LSDRWNGHKVSAGWALGIIAAMLTILSLLGILPWATRAEVQALKVEIGEQFKKIDAKLDRTDGKIDRILGEHGAYLGSQRDERHP